MQIHVNTDKTIEQHAGLDEHVNQVVSSALGRFGEQIARVDVHVSNDLAQKGADGANRCMMEARVNGYQPIAVSDHSVTLHQAINGAADKLKRAVDSALGRLNDSKRQGSARELNAAPSEEE
ncbi:HPF/RaiA family ribosome-associated protein [Massilia endophytica]|uniref:HPF/RaiA family ribosome-associated protein n=1 Tax=Massilia endophytica TaxID=2899220 RepID=UPI001E578DA9|nr:HPF/RaiA family ribosome-associated protein [Massilia endophytica]UGQ47450.1 HPF/RaiA family ribosome-associated protein [Massilia endophytica]